MDVGAPLYVRHRPVRTLPYRLAEGYFPALKAKLAAEGTGLPKYVEQKCRAEATPAEHLDLRQPCSLDAIHAATALVLGDELVG